jgi:hypothetical protein
MLEAGLRDYSADPSQGAKLLKGIDRVLNIALEGQDKDALSAMKLLLDRVMPAMPPKLEEEAQQTDKKLQIIIQTNPNASVPVRAIVDGEFTKIEETQHE